MKPFEHQRKKYFVKDESLRGVDGDMFNYSDIAQVLDDVLTTNTPPYNVAIIGKWGLGKSSLINLVTEKYRKDATHYQIQEINAWKYEKESLRKVFLKQLWQGVSKQRIQSFETVKREIANIINAELPKDHPRKDGGRTKRFLLTLGLIALVSVLAFIVYKIVQAFYLGTPIWTCSFWTQVFLRYCKNVSTVLIGPVLVALCKLLIDDYHTKQSKKIELNFPIETTDDYEIFLETKIKEQLNDNPKLKIITVIDDLDRLSIDKIVEALDALKAFVGFERCIFIVPFDDEIIKCALDKRRMQEFNDRTEITDVIESELILDKLFQFKIYLPPILDFDIQQYAYKLAQQEVPDFISDYCNEATMKKVIERVLIYPGVTTPRQVKKLLNSFINSLMIVSAREASGKIQRGLLTSEEGIMQIAKMSVLQADFNNFYDLLFKDMRCIELLLAAHKGEITTIDLPVYLHNYFAKDGEKVELKNEYETLLNFLNRTAKYRVDSIAPYLYLAQNEISIKTGDELQRRAINALKSRNIQTLRTLFEESSDLAEAIMYQLSWENGEIEDVLWTTMMVYKDIKVTYKPRLAQCIIERTIELNLSESEFLYSIPANNIFDIADNGENNEFNHQFRERYLSVLSNDSLYKEETLRDALATTFENISALSNTAKDMLKNICNFCMENDAMDAASLFDVIDPDKPEFIWYWGVNWLKKLCTYMETNSDFSDTTAKQLYVAFDALAKTVQIDELIAYILPLTQYDAFMPIADTIISMPCEEGSSDCIKDLISEKMATQLLANVITHDFKKRGKILCHILDGLQYDISADNSEAMDEFTLNYATSSLLDNILVYCGKQGYFELLPKTIASISDVVFNDEDNDSLLRNIAEYFTDSQIKLFGKKILDASAYSGGKTYERELTIIEVISDVAEFSEELENVVDSKILPHFASYHTYENYRNFVSAAMGLMKNVLSQECMNKYVDALSSRYNSYRQHALEAVNRIVMKMGSEAFSRLFEKITTQSESSDFDLAIEVIQNHDAIRPNDQENINRYYSFLLKNLPTAENPNRILRIIREVFSSVPDISEIAVNAQKNTAYSTEDLAKTIAHFTNKKKNIEDVSKIIRDLCEAGIENQVIIIALSQINTHQMSEIYIQISDELQHVNVPQVLISITDIACNNIHIPSAQKLVLDCLESTFNKIGLGDCAILIMDQIKSNESAFKNRKDELANVLRSGFVSTTSESLKKSILLLVSNMRIKPQFKKTLTGEDLAYYKKYAS